MATLTGSRLVLAGFLFAACAPQSSLPQVPPEGLEVSWFHRDCAPWDGAALTLALGPEVAGTPFESPFPTLRVSVFRDLATIGSGERLAFEVPGEGGHATYCEDPERCETAVSATVEFSSVESGALAGQLEVRFQSREPIRGSFRASILPFPALCG